MTKPPAQDDPNSRIVAVTLDEESIGRSGPDIEHERAIAIYDLIEQNLFGPDGHEGNGPFTLHIGITGNRLMFDIRREDGAPVVAHLLSLTPFRRIVKDYFMICDSYYQAIRTATPDKIEAIDMGRRGIHDEGSRTLQERLKCKVRLDFETARRLFTLITVLHWKGYDMGRKSVKRFSEKAMSRTRTRMIPKHGNRFSDQILRQPKGA